MGDRTGTGFSTRYGPWAVVTGAAQGIGAAFAAELVTRGLRVLLVDREEDLLADRAAQLRGSGGEVRAVVVDLGQPGGPEQVLDATVGLDVGLLVSNAALSYVGSFLEQSLPDKLAQLDINCRGPLILVDGVLPRLVSRGRGGVILLSSGSALRGSPLVAGYAATKAWNLILAESLWDELRDTGVDVMAVRPGTTRTPGWLSSRPQASLATAAVMEPADVVVEVLDTLGTAPSMAPGQANRDAEAMLGGLDRTDAVRLMGDVLRATYPPGRQADPAV